MGGTLADLDVIQKTEIYHTLYQLNAAFSQVVDNCRKLQKTGLFKSKTTKLFPDFTQELQAEINQELLEELHQFELDDWGRYGKAREKWEKHLRDPDDVFIHAEERRKELAKQKRKKPRR
jgi:hypothetical protein